MASSHDEPPESTYWRNESIAQSYGGVHENTVLFYFNRSPFVDPTSNNVSLFQQANRNPDLFHVLSTREAFEDELRKMRGVEYMVYLSPRDFGPEKPINQGMWVIRKQERQRDGYVRVLGSYYVIGLTIAASPSVGSILEGRLLSMRLSLGKVFEKAAGLSVWEPERGSHYPLSTSSSTSTTTKSQKQREHTLSSPGTQTPQQQTQSQTQTQQSGTATPLPGTSSSSQPSSNPLTTSTGISAKPTNNNATTSTALSILQDTYKIFTRHSYEYMDENPLLGEPGTFHFSTTRQHLQAQQEAASKRREQQEAAQKAKEEDEKRKRKMKSTAVVATVPQIKTESTGPSRKGSRPPDGGSSNAGTGTGGMPKAKRRKSRAPGTPGIGSGMTSPIETES